MDLRKLPPLAPIWLERNPSLEERSFELFKRRFPSWEQLSREGAALQSQIARGEVQWPPAEVLDVVSRSWNHHGDPKSMPAEFRLLNPFQAGVLPSVRSYLTDVADFFLRSPMAHMIRDVDRQLVKPTLMEMVARKAWQHYGKQVYVLDPETYELLVNTDLPAFPADQIRAPLPAFYLKFPPGSFRWSESENGLEFEAEGALVLFDRADGDGFGRSLSVLITGNNVSDPQGRGSFLFSYSYISPRTPINTIAFPGLEPLISGGQIDAAVNDVPHAILGFCLYLMSQHPDITPVPPARRDLSGIKSSAKRRKAEKRNQSVSALGYLYVGGRDAVERPAGAGESGRRLTRTSWTRGHFRNQPYGPGRRQYKIIWIKPYQRGPDFSESLAARAQKVQRGERT